MASKDLDPSAANPHDKRQISPVHLGRLHQETLHLQDQGEEFTHLIPKARQWHMYEGAIILSGFRIAD